MQALYKGFIPTKDKVPLKKFKDAKDLLTLSQAQELDEYAGLLADEKEIKWGMDAQAPFYFQKIIDIIKQKLAEIEE